MSAPQLNSSSDYQAELIARRRRLLGPAYRLFYDDPVHPVRGVGTWLYDREGAAYLDAYNNVPCVGHCHPQVLGALTHQAGVLNTHTRYLDENILEYAERLLGTFPPGLENLMLTCSGSESTDLACRLARAATGGEGFIVTDFAYHGATVAASELSPSLGGATKLAGTTRTVRSPDLYRAEGRDVAEDLAHDVRIAIDDLAAHGMRPAALLIDSVFANEGILAEPAGMLVQAAAVIHEAGGVLIVDEVQAGFGRTGEDMWGFARHNITPDIVTLGKAMGGGHPIGGVVARPEILEAFAEQSRYFNTYGGNPVSCSVASAVLDVIERDNLVEHANNVGSALRDGLWQLAERHLVIGDVRGAGLLVGVELVGNRKTREAATSLTQLVVNGLRERRVLVGITGPASNVIKIRPPLVFSNENAGQLLSALEDVLAESSGRA